MPFCPKCRYKYVNGILKCSDCGVDLVSALPPLETPQDAEIELTEVWRAQGEVEAQLIRSLLESNDIESVLSGEALRLTHGFTVDGLAEVRILVRREDAKRAEEVIAAAGGMPKCPKCGKSVREEDTVCRFCGEQFEE